MAVPGDATRWLLAIGSSTARRHLTFPHQLVDGVGSLWHDGVGYALIVASDVNNESDRIEMSMPIGWRRFPTV